MIRTQDEFDTAFEKAIAYLAHPPQPGSDEDKAFGELLRDLAAYRHSMDDALLPEHPAAVAFAALDDELRAFRQRYPERHAHDGELSLFGFGHDLRAPG